MGGSGLASKGINAAQTFQEGYLGQKEYNNMLSDQEYYSSQEWRDARRAGISQKEMDMYRQNGITDTSQILKAQNAAMDNYSDKDTAARMGQYAIRLANSIPTSSPTKMKQYQKAYGIPNDLWDVITKIKAP